MIKMNKIFLALLIIIINVCNNFVMGTEILAKNNNIFDKENNLMIAKNPGTWFDEMLGTGEDESNSLSGLANTFKELILTDAKSLIERIGGIVFVLIGAFLGVKYLISAAEGKTEIKQSLISYILSIVIFYCATNLFGIFETLLKDIGSTGLTEDTVNKILGNVGFIIRLLAVGTVIFIGVKYMFSSAQGKANLKKELITALIGLILIYSVNSIIILTSKIGNSIFNNSNQTENKVTPEYHEKLPGGHDIMDR